LNETEADEEGTDQSNERKVHQMRRKGQRKELSTNLETKQKKTALDRGTKNLKNKQTKKASLARNDNYLICRRYRRI
jgi:hypothetical protein